MKKLILILLILGIVYWIVPKNGVQGQSGENFVIVNADASNTLSMTASSGLNALIANVADRIVLQYANASRYYGLVPAPAGLLTLMGQVDNRFVLQYANANAWYAFGFPVSLIGDHNPPLASNIAAAGAGAGSVLITWTTNEYTASIIDYGIQPGVYPQSVTDDLFKKQHELLLSGLSSGETYYYRIRSTDRSGNQSQSQEQSFAGSIPVFMPLIIR